MFQAEARPALEDLEARIRAKSNEALSLAQAGRLAEARTCYAEMAVLVAQRPRESVRRMELELGLA